MKAFLIFITKKHFLERESDVILTLYVTCLESKAIAPGFELSAFFLCSCVLKNKNCFTAFLCSIINK